MTPQTLLHMTDTLESIESILEWGFLFSYNSTEVLKSLIGRPAAHVSVLDPGGMVCMTELSYIEAKRVFDPRKYGISVSISWAITVGARPVQYIDPEIDTNLSIFRDKALVAGVDSLPEELKNSPELQRWLLELAASNPEFAKSLGLPQDFIDFQSQALWMQTIGHKEEQEWRIRSPRGFPNIEDIPNRKQQAELLLSMVKNIPQTRNILSIKVPPKELVSIHTPKWRVVEARKMLERTGYLGCDVETI